MSDISEESEMQLKGACVEVPAATLLSSWNLFVITVVSIIAVVPVVLMSFSSTSNAIEELGAAFSTEWVDESEHFYASAWLFARFANRSLVSGLTIEKICPMLLASSMLSTVGVQLRNGRVWSCWMPNGSTTPRYQFNLANSTVVVRDFRGRLPAPLDREPLQGQETTTHPIGDLLGPSWYGPHLAPDNAASLSVAVPVKNESRQLAGLFIAVTRFAKLSQILQAASRSFSAALVLHRDSGEVLATSWDEALFKPMGSTNSSDASSFPSIVPVSKTARLIHWSELHHSITLDIANLPRAALANDEVYQQGNLRVYPFIQQHLHNSPSFEAGDQVPRLALVVKIDPSMFRSPLNNTVYVLVSVFVAALIVTGVLSYIFGSVVFAQKLDSITDKLKAEVLVTAPTTELEPPSIIAEIARIQHALHTITIEIQKIARFVPMNVLPALLPPTTGAAATAAAVANNEEELESISDGSASFVGPCFMSSSFAPNASMDPSTNVGARLLNTALKTQFAEVSVMVVNVRRFLSQVQLGTQPENHALDSLIDSWGKIVDLVHSLVASFGGNVDFFSGDRFLISFNTVTKTVQHKKTASRCALRLCHEFALFFAKGPSRMLLALPHGLSIGLASGKALYGNIGTPEAARFSVIGEVTAFAFELEKRCTAVYADAAKYRTSETASNDFHVCTTADILADLHNEFYWQHLGPFTVHMKSTGVSRSVPLVALLSDPLGSEEIAETEWMYRLQQAQEADPYAALNEAFKYYYDGRKAEARRVLASIPNRDRLFAAQCLYALLR